MEAAPRGAEKSRVPSTVGAPAKRRNAAASSFAEVGRARATASGGNAATHRIRTGRVRGQRLRTAGVGAGGRRRGEPLVARACRTLSLPGVPRALRRELALLGTEWPPG